MTKSKKILKYIEANRSTLGEFSTNVEAYRFLGEMFDTCHRYVRQLLQRKNITLVLHKKIAKNKVVHTAESRKIWDETTTGASLDYVGEKEITSKEEAIDFFEIDTTIYEVDRMKVNSWPTTMKVDVYIHKETGKKYITGTPFNKDDYAKMQVEHQKMNYQTTLWLKNIQNRKSYFDLRDEIIAEMKSYAPVYPTIKRVTLAEPLMAVLPLADLHVGKYHKDYNMAEAVRRADIGVDKLIKKLQLRNIDKIVLVGGNDMQHTENGKATTSGTPQDTDGLWHEHYQTSKKICISAIEKLATVADVHYVHVVSNHDERIGYALSDAISCWFHNYDNVTFDVSMTHRKYIHYGVSLIGFSHGDGAKESQLPDLMKTEAKKAWSESKFGYWYLGHIHHKDRKTYKATQKKMLEKDFMDVMVVNTNVSISPSDEVYVEYCRSMGGSDYWHDKKGYVYSPMALECFIHDPNHGQTDRMTTYF